MLVLSSLTTQGRYAAIAWVAVCLFGHIVYLTLSNVRDLRDASWTFLASLYEVTHVAQLAVLDVSGEMRDAPFSGRRDGVMELLSSDSSPVLAVVWLAALCGACFFFLVRRVTAPTRI